MIGGCLLLPSGVSGEGVLKGKPRGPTGIFPDLPVSQGLIPVGVRKRERNREIRAQNPCSNRARPNLCPLHSKGLHAAVYPRE